MRAPFLAFATSLLFLAAGPAQPQGVSESPVYHRSRPGDGSALVVPSDTQNLPRMARVLYVEHRGTVRFMALDGTVDTWSIAEDYVYIPVTVKRVMLTGTTATGIHAIF